LSVSVCLSVRSHISTSTRPNFTKFAVRVNCGHGLILLCRPCNTLCISGFVGAQRLIAGNDTAMQEYALYRVSVHCVSKNVPPLTCYNLGIHDPITINFGRYVTEKVRNQMVLFSHFTYLVLLHYLAKQETQKTVHWCILCVPHSPTAAALSTSFIMPPTARR